MSRTADIAVPGRHLCSIGEIIDFRYRIVSELGEGTYGHVYKVVDNTGREYALKLLHLWDISPDIRKELVDRFEMEYQTGRIQSEHLVHSVDLGYIEGNPYIVMEFCNGGDLTSKMNDDGDRTARYACDILKGLHSLHKNGKVHRDLKPENVLIKENGMAALTDFGISGDRNKRMTERNIFGRPYQIFGTYAYMPPEQVSRKAGGSTVLPTTDIFSFGVLLYQMITGQLPFGTLNDHNDLAKYQIKSKAGDWDRRTLLCKPRGRYWENLIGRCLEPEYTKRLQSADEALRMIPHFGDAESRFELSNKIEPVQSSSSAPKGFVLKVLQGKEFGKEYDIFKILDSNSKSLVTVGRGLMNDIQLLDFETFYTSRKHFTIEVDRKSMSFHIRDGQWDNETRQWKPSANGTYVNSSRIDQTGTRLNPNDIITVGEITLKLEQY